MKRKLSNDGQQYSKYQRNTSHFKSLNIKKTKTYVLAWDRHTNVAGLNQDPNKMID